ncbi:MAG: hypothetical protein ACP6IY_19615 [Promethearchaeia archaeon]
MFEMLILGLSIVILPALYTSKYYDLTVVKAYFTLLFIAYASFGLYAMMDALFLGGTYDALLTNNCFYFALICLIVLARCFNLEREDQYQKIEYIQETDIFSKISKTFWIFLNLIVYGILGVILFVLIIINPYWYVFVGMALYGFTLICFALIVVKGRYENKRAAIRLSLILITLFYAFTYIGAYLSPYSALYIGQSADFGEATKVLGDIIFSITQNSLFMLVLVLILVGGLAKVVSASKAAALVSNILVLWLPAFIWILVIFGVVPVPPEIIDIFGGIEFLAWLMYILIYGALMVLASGAVQVFQSLRIMTFG